MTEGILEGSAKYSMMVYVSDRMLRHFTVEQIEMSAKISIVHNLPSSWDLADDPDYQISWSNNVLTNERVLHIKANVVRED